METSYSVLSPWADTDPLKLKGLTPRISNMEGKRIGLFCNVKPLAKPMLAEVESRLKAVNPNQEVKWYFEHDISSPEMETQYQSQLEDWLKGVDAVIASVGD